MWTYSGFSKLVLYAHEHCSAKWEIIPCCLQWLNLMGCYFLEKLQKNCWLCEQHIRATVRKAIGCYASSSLLKAFQKFAVVETRGFRFFHSIFPPNFSNFCKEFENLFRWFWISSGLPKMVPLCTELIRSHIIFTGLIYPSQICQDSSSLVQSCFKLPETIQTWLDLSNF